MSFTKVKFFVNIFFLRWALWMQVAGPKCTIAQKLTRRRGNLLIRRAVGAMNIVINWSTFTPISLHFRSRLFAFTPFSSSVVTFWNSWGFLVLLFSRTLIFSKVVCFQIIVLPFQQTLRGFPNWNVVFAMRNDFVYLYSYSTKTPLQFEFELERGFPFSDAAPLLSKYMSENNSKKTDICYTGCPNSNDVVSIQFIFDFHVSFPFVKFNKFARIKIKKIFPNYGK